MVAASLSWCELCCLVFIVNSLFCCRSWRSSTRGELMSIRENSSSRFIFHFPYWTSSSKVPWLIFCTFLHKTIQRFHFFRNSHIVHSFFCIFFHILLPISYFRFILLDLQYLLFMFFSIFWLLCLLLCTETPGKFLHLPYAVTICWCNNQIYTLDEETLATFI